MKQEEVIARICSLMTEVNREVFNHSVAADCFCQGDVLPIYYRFDEEVLEWVEAAIRKEIYTKRGEV